MAERIACIEAQAFRGVPGEFTLDLMNGRSCVVLGDNATGKSTIADAVEWYLTGKIESLTKEGRADAIRHSGAEADQVTRVALSTDGSLGGESTMSSLSPASVRQVGQSELFLLRGHTLAEFIDKTKGKKWEALAELLGLEAIDHMRLELQRVRNELEDSERNARREVDSRQSTLRQRVGDVSDARLLEAFRRRCRDAQIEAPHSLDQVLNEQWIRAIVPEGSPDDRVVRLQTALDELRAIAAAPVSLSPIDEWNAFVEQAEAADRLRLGLYTAADSLIRAGYADESRCPLCEQSVDLDSLANHITVELESLQEAASALEKAQQAIRRFISEHHETHRRRGDIRQQALQHGVELVQVPISRTDEWREQVDRGAAIDDARALNDQQALDSWDREAIDVLQLAIPSASSEREQMLIDIALLHSEASAWRDAVRQFGGTSAAFQLADRLFTKYQEREHQLFSDVLQQVSTRVAQIYHFLHPEAGIGAVSVETVGEKGAELAVEFHGKKESPPHRVLSESHLNSLGVALFLAMAETFNEQLGFLILDDVVNSFDRSHRGRLAELLAHNLPDTQLVILTHDEQFFTRLCQLSPSWIHAEFTSWTYEEGPRTRQYESERLLEQAAAQLAEGDRNSAAQKTRRALEEFLQEACERLEALLLFRRGHRNDQRMADECMKGLRRTLKERSRPLYESLTDVLNEIEGDLQAALNVESHASQGGTSDQEIRDALGRVIDLRSRFVCADCGTRVWHSGSPESCRCRCGHCQFPPPS